MPLQRKILRCVIDFTCNIYNSVNIEWNYCKEYEQFERVKRCKICKDCKKLSDYCKECDKTYTRTVYVVLNMQKQEKNFFESLRCQKRIAISSEYHISKFPDLSNFCKKDLGKLILLLKRCDVLWQHWFMGKLIEKPL